MKKNRFSVALLAAAAVFGGMVHQAAFATGYIPQPPTPCPCEYNSWYLAFGSSFPIISNSGSVSGDLALTTLGGDYSVNGLKYTTQLAPEIFFGHVFSGFFDLALMYSYVGASIDSTGATGTGSEAGLFGAYSAQIGLNNFLLRPRFTWRDAIRFGNVGLSPYLALDGGVTVMQLSNQFIAIQDGLFAQYLQPHSVTNFAWGGELGLLGALGHDLSFSIGVRYLNYGSFNSGNSLVGNPNIKQAVSANLYSVAPFIDVSYQF